MSALSHLKREPSLGEKVAKRPEGSLINALGRPKHESSSGKEVAQRPEGSLADAERGSPPASILRRIESLNRIIRSHAGGLDLVEVTTAGEVVVRYTGMCAGCEYRPSTTVGTIEPALLDVPGVHHVTILGSRIDDDAMTALRSTLHGAGAPQRAVRLTRRMESLEP